MSSMVSCESTEVDIVRPRASMGLTERGRLVSRSMLDDAAGVKAGQGLLQLRIGHGAVLGNQREGQVSRYPDDALATWQACQNSRQAVESVQAQYRPLVLRIAGLRSCEGF